MNRKYSIDTSDTNTVNVSMLELRSTTAVKPVIYDVVLGSAATPADQAAQYSLNRTTTAGTSTTVTPQALDPDSPAATSNGQENHSAEPTVTANAILLTFSLNQRATFRWVAAPDGGLVLPAAVNGVTLRGVIVTSAVIVESMFHFAE